MAGAMIEVDGFNIQQEHMGAATRTGRYGMPERRGENLVIPGRSGSTFVANKPYEVGIGALSVWTIGGTTSSGKLVVPASQLLRQQQFETNIATLERLFTVNHRLSTIRTAQPDGTVRRTFVEWKEWDQPEVVAGGTRAEWSIGYEIPGTWWEDDTALATISSSTGGSLPKDLDLTTLSGMTGVIEDPVLYVNGAVTNPRITDLETGRWVQYTGTVANGTTWFLDAGNFTSAVGASNVMGQTTHGGGYELFVIPNRYGAQPYARLRLSGTSPGVNVSFGVSSPRRRWVHG